MSLRELVFGTGDWCFCCVAVVLVTSLSDIYYDTTCLSRYHNATCSSQRSQSCQKSALLDFDVARLARIPKISYSAFLARCVVEHSVLRDLAQSDKTSVPRCQCRQKSDRP